MRPSRSTTRLPLLVLPFLAHLLATGAHAAVNAWSPVQQPEGLRVEEISISPVDSSIVYMLGTGGLRRSDDGGMTWAFLSQQRLTAIPDPLDADTVWLQDGSAVFRSDQRGATAIPVRSPVEGRAFTLQIAAGSPRTLYAKVANQQLWRSEDGGNSWTRLILPDGIEIFNDGLALNPLRPDELLLAVRGGEILRSNDRGDSWLPVDAPRPRGNFRYLVFDGASPGHAYLGRGPDIYRSTDGGRTWQDFDHRDDPIRFLTFVPGSPGLVYAGTEDAFLLRSTDGALTWEILDDDICGSPRTIAASSETVFTGTTSGIFRQAPGDSAWSSSHAGLHLIQLSSIEADPSRPGTLFGTTRWCLYRTRDGGETWAHLPQGSNPRLSPQGSHVVSVPTEPPTLFVGSSTGLFRSVDDGETWTKAFNALTLESFGPWFDPADPSVLWVGIADYYIPYDNGLYRSRDSGETWEELSSFEGSLVALAIDSGPPRVLYSDLSRSLDEGDTWTVLPRPEGLRLWGVVAGLSESPESPLPLYSGGRLDERNGILRSTDGSETWSFTSDDSTFAEAEFVSLEAVDPAVPGTLWAWSEATSLVRSRDAGTTWSPAASGLPEDMTRIDLEINPAAPARVWALTSTRSFQESNLYSVVIRDAVARFDIEPGEDLEPGDTITFRERSLGAPVSWNWDFGDGTTAEGAEVSHAYAEPGTYVVTLEIATPFDDRATARQTLVVGDDGGPGMGGPCVEGPDVLCLQDGRFEVRVTWETRDGDRGTAHPAPPRSPDSGLLWFFSAENWEMLVKVLDGCSSNGHFWVFAATASTVGFDLQVTDLVAEETRVFRNAPGQAAQAVADIRAFATCAERP